MKWLLVFIPLSLSAQTVTLHPIGNQSAAGATVEMEHFVTSVTGRLDVKVFRTHYGNGNTSQYASYPLIRSEMDKLFNTAYAATTLWWSGQMNATTVLNWTSFGTLTGAGAGIPPGGEFFSLEARCTFVPAETGQYAFRATSDDGCDLWVNGSIIEWYGGKGTGTYKYGYINMVAGQQYTFIARVQEFGGGEGLILNWKRPSQANYAIHTSEIGVSTSGWVYQGSKLTNIAGVASWSNPSNWPYRVTVDVSDLTHELKDEDLLYITEKKGEVTALQSWDFYTCDCDNSSTFDIADIEFCYMLLTKGFSHNKYIFTAAERVAIEADPSTSYYQIYFPRQKVTVENQNQFYIMGTGKHRTTTLMQKMQ